MDEIEAEGLERMGIAGIIESAQPERPLLVELAGGRFLLSASYPGHKVTVNTIGPDGLVGPVKQVLSTPPNAHAIIPDTSNRHVLVPSLGSDTLLGLSGVDFLFGGVGDDYLDGGEGNDSLFGNEGSDKLIGGAGSDILDGGADADKIDALDGEIDVIFTDPLDGVDPERLRLLLREIFTAAGGKHEDFDEYDRVMATERRVAVLVRPERVTSNRGA